MRPVGLSRKISIHGSVQYAKILIPSNPSLGTNPLTPYSKTASNGAVFVILPTICRPNSQLATSVSNAEQHLTRVHWVSIG